MSAITGPALVAAVVLSLAGAQKVVDPEMAVGALRALRLPSAPVLVRLGSAAEVALGVGAIAVGGALTWSLVAASYLAFAGFVVTAMRRGTMVSTCGCFGREETPPHVLHVILNVAMAGVTLAAALGSSRSAVDVLVDEPAEGLLTAALVAVAVRLVYSVYVDVPRVAARAAAVRQIGLAELAQASDGGRGSGIAS